MIRLNKHYTLLPSINIKPFVKIKMIKIPYFLFFLLFSYNINAKNITVIATGGTIAGAGESSFASKYSASKVSIDKIIKTIPNITKLANIKAEQFMQVSSQDMNNSLWLKLAKKVNDTLSKDSVDGVIITHGTDTMEETAYFLNLVVKSTKPVILVGSMRPSTSLSADGNLNLYNAVALASSDEAINKGVLIIMNDRIYTARDATKFHTTNVASFQSNNSGPIGQIHYGDVEIYYSSTRSHTKKTEFNINKLDKLPKVDVVYAHANHDPSIIDHLVKSGSQAIVVAGVGDGNVNEESLQKLSEARKQGVIIVRSSRLGSGVIDRNAEINDDELDFITADNLNPQKARILTMLALTKTRNTKLISKMFSNY